MAAVAIRVAYPKTAVVLLVPDLAATLGLLTETTGFRHLRSPGNPWRVPFFCVRYCNVLKALAMNHICTSKFAITKAN